MTSRFDVGSWDTEYISSPMAADIFYIDYDFEYFEIFFMY